MKIVSKWSQDWYKTHSRPLIFRFVDLGRKEAVLNVALAQYWRNTKEWKTHFPRAVTRTVIFLYFCFLSSSFFFRLSFSTRQQFFFLSFSSVFLREIFSSIVRVCQCLSMNVWVGWCCGTTWQQSGCFIFFMIFIHRVCQYCSCFCYYWIYIRYF